MKTLTIKGKCDGFGAQYQAIMSGIAYCNYMNYKYIHSPFQKMAHDGNPEKLNEFIGISSPSYETNVDMTVKCCGEVHFSKNPDMYYNIHVISILQKYYYSTPKPNIIIPNIAVHIRRGDVNENNEKRYTTNDQYKEILSFLLEKYPYDTITIFSEGKIDDFHELQQERVHFKLNDSIEESFHSLVTAKVLVMAKSSFSYSAALLNQNIVYYIPFWHKPLKKWKIL